MAGGGLGGRLEHRHVAQARGAVERVGLDGAAHQRPLATGVDRHVLAAGDQAQDAGVAGRQLGVDVAGHRGDPDQVEDVGGGEGEEQGDGVVDAGIAIDDEGGSGHPP